jgi:GLPGLI family protein
MIKFYSCILFFALSFTAINTNAQKTLSEGTLVYNMSVETGSAEPKMADMLDGATTTISIKGDQSRVELVSGLGREATIFNAATANGFILKDYSGQKLMITLTSKDWDANNKKYEGIEFENTGETSVISGFTCKKAIAKLKNGSSFTIYYTDDVNIQNKSYDAQFKTLPGLPVQYEMQAGKMKFKFTLASINFDAVPSSKFEMPKSGYRVMTYQETKK